MLDVLVASKPPHHAGPGELLTSSLLHVGLLSLAVASTHTAVQVAREIVSDTSLIYLPRLAPPAVERPPAGGPHGGGGGSEGALIITTNPPPRGFQVVAAVFQVPTDLPPIDPNDRALDARDFTGRGTEGGVGWGVVGGVGPADQPPAQIAEMLYSASTEDVRFMPAELVTAPEFQYPAVLRAAGLPGRVVLQFIIDTLGGVEPGSITILERSHEAFATAAREGVMGARFQPAHYGERAVRQLSKWPVKFALVVN